MIKSATSVRHISKKEKEALRDDGAHCLRLCCVMCLDASKSQSRGHTLMAQQEDDKQRHVERMVCTSLAFSVHSSWHVGDR